MIKNIRIELFLGVFILLILTITGLGYLIANPIEKEVIEYKNVTIPCPEKDCRAEVLQAKLDCLENKQKEEEPEESTVDCLLESTKPQWCPGYKCPSTQYCHMEPNSLIGACVDRKCK